MLVLRLVFLVPGAVVTVVAWYGITVGVLMLAWWTVELRGGALRRSDRRPAEIGLHLGAEIVAAVVLVVGGARVLLDGSASLLLVGLGMLLYTVIQSPGYFLTRREAVPVVMFAALAVATLAAIVVVI